MCDAQEQVRKLVEILSIALRCGNLTGDQSDLTRSIQSALMIVAGDKGRVGTSGSGSSSTVNSSSVHNNNNKPSIFTFLNNFAKIDPVDDNGTNIPLVHGASDSSPSFSYNYSDNNFSLFTSDMRMTTFPTLSTTSAPPPPPGLKLHRLEIIKVVVLIIVISIILLTTCRMIFQLFLRFKPEKPP